MENLLKIKVSLKCAKCNMIPFIIIIPSSPLKISIKCKCLNKKLLLTKYLNDIKTKNSISKTYTHYCQSILSHCYNSSSGFCLFCQEYLCKQCISTHKKYFNNRHRIIKKELYSFCQCFHSWDSPHLFCIDCFKVYCPRCNISHKSHSSLQPITLDIKEIKRTIIRVQNIYKDLLYYTFLEANSKNETLIKSYKSCLKKNSQILHLLKILLFNYIRNDYPYSFVMKENIYRNINFNLNPSNYKKLPNLKTINDYITFFNHFCLTHPKEPHEVSKVTINTISEEIPNYNSIIVTAILTFKLSNFFLLGDSKGNLILYTVLPDYFAFIFGYIYYQAHSDEVTYLNVS